MGHGDLIISSGDYLDVPLQTDNGDSDETSREMTRRSFIHLDVHVYGQLSHSGASLNKDRPTMIV